MIQIWRNFWLGFRKLLRFLLTYKCLRKKLYVNFGLRFESLEEFFFAPQITETEAGKWHRYNDLAFPDFQGKLVENARRN